MRCPSCGAALAHLVGFGPSGIRFGANTRETANPSRLGNRVAQNEEEGRQDKEQGALHGVLPLRDCWVLRWAELDSSELQPARRLPTSGTR